MQPISVEAFCARYQQIAHPIANRLEWRQHWAEGSDLVFLGDPERELDVMALEWSTETFGLEGQREAKSRWRWWGSNVAVDQQAFMQFDLALLPHDKNQLDLMAGLVFGNMASMLTHGPFSLAYTPTFILDVPPGGGDEYLTQHFTGKAKNDLKRKLKNDQIEGAQTIALTSTGSTEFVENIRKRYQGWSTWDAVPGRIERLLGIDHLKQFGWTFDLVSVTGRCEWCREGGLLGQAILCHHGEDSLYLTAWNHRGPGILQRLVLDSVSACAQRNSQTLNLMATAADWKRRLHGREIPQYWLKTSIEIGIL